MGTEQVIGGRGPAAGDRAADKGCPGAAACLGSGAGEPSPGCAGLGAAGMGPLLALGLLVCGRLCGAERRAAGAGPAAVPGPAQPFRAAGSGQLRLVGGGGRCAGRVEVKHGGDWGSVCLFDFGWKPRWATVVCRQLGCGRVAAVSPLASFGQGTGRIWLQPIACNGSEDALAECRHLGWGRHLCGHERDAGVICTGEGTRWRCWGAPPVLEHPGQG